MELISDVKMIFLNTLNYLHIFLYVYIYFLFYIKIFQKMAMFHKNARLKINLKERSSGSSFKAFAI